MTNFERIKNMSVEEFRIAFETTPLCSYIHNLDNERCEKCDSCIECQREWLEEEVSEGETL